MKIWFYLLFLTPLTSYGQGNDYFTCNKAAVRKIKTDEENCNRMSYRPDQSQCLSRAYKELARNACSIPLIAMGRSVSFIYSRMADLDSSQRLKEGSAYQLNVQYWELKKIAEKEIRDGIADASREIDSVKSEMAIARANASIDQAIYVFGGSVNRTSDTTFTYIYKGKPTTCSTTGNIINCL